MSQKKIVFRPLFYAFVSFALTIIFARRIFSGNVEYVLFAVFLLILVTFLCIRFKCAKRLILIGVCIVLGFVWFFGGLNVFMGKDYKDRTCTVSGRVTRVESAASQVINLQNVYVNGERQVSGISLKIYTNGVNLVELGDILTFDAKLSQYNMFSLGSFNPSYYKNNTSHFAYINKEAVTIDRIGATFSDKLKESIKNLLNSNMSEQSAEVAYSALFGDKTELDPDIKEDFVLSGIAHMLAVSGLHIGIFASFIMFILKRCKSKPIVNFIILGVILIFYSYLCGFSASVVRATIMCLVLTFSKVVGRQYDGLNSLSLAGLIILSVKPFYIFDAGFLLSFFSVLSIILLFKLFKRIFNYIKLPSFISSPLALTLCVQFGILSIMTLYFKQVSVLSVVANFILVPIFEIAFTCLFAIVPLVALMPFLSFLLFIPDFLLRNIIIISSFIAQQKWALMSLTASGIILIITTYFTIFIFSKRVMLKGKIKIYAVSLLLTITMIVNLIANVPAKFTDLTITNINTYANTCFLSYQNSCIFIIDEELSEYESNLINKFFDYKNIYNIDLVINFKTGQVFENLNLYKPRKILKDISFNTVYQTENIKYEKVKLASTYNGFIFTFGNDSVYFPTTNVLNEGEKLTFKNRYYDKNIIAIRDFYEKDTNLIDEELYDYRIGGNFITDKSEYGYKNLVGNYDIIFDKSTIIKVRSLD